jgi:Spermine/spermidine synthase domain
MPSLTNVAKNRAPAGLPRPQTGGFNRVAVLLSTGRRIAAAGVKWTRSSAGGSFGSGCFAGLYVVGFCHALTARFGDSLPILAGVVTATAMGTLAGTFGLPNRGETSRWRLIALCVVLAAWTIAFRWLTDFAGLGYRWISLSLLTSPWVQYGIALGIGLVLLGVPAACAARMGFRIRSVRVEWMLIGASVGLALAANVVAPILGVQWALWIAAVGSLAIVLSRPRQESRTDEPARSVALSIPKIAWPVFGSVAVGMAAAGISRLTLQLFPSAEALQWTAWTGFLIGTAAGWFFARRGTADQQRRAAARLALCGAFCIVLPFLCFGMLTDWFLATTSGVPQVGLLLLIRAAAAAALLFPLGAVWGGLVSLGRRNVDGEAPGDSLDPLLRSALLLPAGYLATLWLLSHSMDLPTQIAGVAVLIAVVATAVSFRQTAWRRQWRGAVALAALVGLIAAGRIAGTYSPSRAARLLFSTEVFMDRRGGTEARLLPFLDEARLVASEEGNRGTYTLWKRHGVQLELRENGIPLGTYCGQADVCPQYSGQVLTSALPLTLHESPRRVLMLGLGSGSTLLAALEYPVSEVTCVERDGRLIDLLERAAFPSGPSAPHGDNRVHIVELDPVAAVQARAGSYDVVVADTEPAGIAGGTPYFTQEFYAGVSRQLEGDGIFAQRFPYVDFGPWPIASVLATLRSVFTDVAAVEAGGGDLVLLATNSQSGLDRPDLFKRFQMPQTCRTLSNVGWDWSVALNLGAYRAEACEAIARGARVNTASSGLFAYSLPQETMRWGAKQNELAQVLNPHAGRIAEWSHAEGNDPELLRRLSDVLLQRELMTKYPDQPWAYRKSVHDELIKHPHTVIAEATDGFDRQLHPVDKRRLNYFSALGHAAQVRRPTLEALHELEDFAEPYDPVLTYFVHHELASLYGRTASPDPAAQMRHRLYTVYYGDARDRSIRDVVEALQLIAANPQSFTATERWDHLNSLLQFLKLRWNNRGLSKPQSVRIILNDVDRTIAAADSTFAEMEKIRPVVGISESEWLARREVIERSLIRPLRAYQSELVPDYLKEIQPPATAAKKAPATTKQNAN